MQGKRDRKSTRRAKTMDSDQPIMPDIDTPVDLPSHENENPGDGLNDETQDDDTASGNLIRMEDRGGGGGG